MSKKNVAEQNPKIVAIAAALNNVTTKVTYDNDLEMLFLSAEHELSGIEYAMGKTKDDLKFFVYNDDEDWDEVTVVDIPMCVASAMFNSLADQALEYAMLPEEDEDEDDEEDEEDEDEDDEDEDEDEDDE